MSLDPTQLRHQLAACGDVNDWWLAYSGGLDSQVLLHLAVAAGLNRHNRLRALHIHHGLQAEADQWLHHCQAQCDALGVPLETVRLQLGGEGNEEARAREARYGVFASRLCAGDVLLMAHHGDDQVETLLLRLLRGAGVSGLAAMPEQRALGAGRLFRPLLAWSRAELEAYARRHGLQWVEDSSNRNTAYDRNYLRQRVVPPLKARWPALNRVVSRCAQHCAESDALLRELGSEDLERCQAPLGGLDLGKLKMLSRGRQKLLLRAWVEAASLPVPEAIHLDRVLDELVPARGDADPCVAWSGVEVRRYRNVLYLKSAWPEPPAASRPWRPEDAVVTPAGTLRAEAVQGEGLRWPRGAVLTVGFRGGGERIALPGRGGSRALKKLLQEAGVPPWLRPWLPLIYVDGKLAAVADRWLDRAFVADPGEDGIRLRWCPGNLCEKEATGHGQG